jgi:hypothetical protein
MWGVHPGPMNNKGLFYLLGGIIRQSLDDISGKGILISDTAREEAYYFLGSEECREYCQFISWSYERIWEEATRLHTPKTPYATV